MNKNGIFFHTTLQFPNETQMEDWFNSTIKPKPGKSILFTNSWEIRDVSTKEEAIETLFERCKRRRFNPEDILKIKQEHCAYTGELYFNIRTKKALELPGPIQYFLDYLLEMNQDHRLYFQWKKEHSAVELEGYLNANDFQDIEDALIRSFKNSILFGATGTSFFLPNNGPAILHNMPYLIVLGINSRNNKYQRLLIDRQDITPKISGNLKLESTIAQIELNYAHWLKPKRN
jgi:hypothetical protein